jgi:hypothetical protein
LISNSELILMKLCPFVSLPCIFIRSYRTKNTILRCYAIMQKRTAQCVRLGSRLAAVGVDALGLPMPLVRTLRGRGRGVREGKGGISLVSILSMLKMQTVEIRYGRLAGAAHGRLASHLLHTGHVIATARHFRFRFRSGSRGGRTAWRCDGRRVSTTRVSGCARL